MKRWRNWVLKFGPAIARRLRRHRSRPSDRWHLDEMVVRIAGERMYLWRAVDHQSEVLDMLVQRRRDGRAALRLRRKVRAAVGLAVLEGSARAVGPLRLDQAQPSLDPLNGEFDRLMRL